MCAFSDGITRSILHAVGASARSTWARETPKAQQQQQWQERGEAVGTRAGDESVAAHSAARVGSRRMTSHDTVAILAEVAGSKSIGLARCEHLHISGISAEQRGQHFLDSRVRRTVRKGGAVRSMGTWTRPISWWPARFRHIGTEVVAVGALCKKGGAGSPVKMAARRISTTRSVLRHVGLNIFARAHAAKRETRSSI